MKRLLEFARAVVLTGYAIVLFVVFFPALVVAVLRDAFEESRVAEGDEL